MPTDTKVETPRTDEVSEEMYDADVCGDKMVEYVIADFARGLERELTALTAELEEARRRVKWLEDRVASMALDMDEMSQEER